MSTNQTMFSMHKLEGNFFHLFNIRTIFYTIYIVAWRMTKLFHDDILKYFMHVVEADIEHKCHTHAGASSPYSQCWCKPFLPCNHPKNNVDDWFASKDDRLVSDHSLAVISFTVSMYFLAVIPLHVENAQTTWFAWVYFAKVEQFSVGKE